MTKHIKLNFVKMIDLFYMIRNEDVRVSEAGYHDLMSMRLYTVVRRHSSLYQIVRKDRSY